MAKTEAPTEESRTRDLRKHPSDIESDITQLFRHTSTFSFLFNTEDCTVTKHFQPTSFYPPGNHRPAASEPSLPFQTGSQLPAIGTRILHRRMQISETNSAKGKSERSEPSWRMNSCSLCEPFCGYSKPHSVLSPSNNEGTVLSIVTVTSQMVAIFPLGILLDLWL